MSTTAKTVLGVVIAIVVIGGIVWASQSKNNTSNSSSPTSTQSTSSSSSAAATPQAAATITFSDTGFSPATVTIKSGESVKIVNSSSQPMQLDSDPHPVHTDNPELNVGEIEPGQNKTVTLNTKGNWGYHDHLSPNFTGRIHVE